MILCVLRASALQSGRVGDTPLPERFYTFYMFYTAKQKKKDLRQ